MIHSRLVCLFFPEAYSQQRQNCLHNYFQVEIDKELPKEFPKPPLVGKQDVGNFALLYTAKTLEAPGISQKNSREGSSSVIEYLFFPKLGAKKSTQTFFVQSFS